jgi:hypothetical protein
MEYDIDSINGDLMSLAYNLNVDNLLNVENLSNAIISQPNTIGMFGPFGNERFMSLSGGCQQIYPTGEYIIRDGFFANGIYIYVGSYKAYIRDLFGAGSHGYAWDGFIMTMRGYSINQPNGFNIIGDGGISFRQDNFGFLPMRMPIEVNPGAIGDAVAIAADSSVGLQSLDFYKSIDDVYVQPSDPSIRIITCGFQRIDATVEGVPTGSDYVGNLYLGEILTFDNIENTTPADSRFVMYNYLASNVVQVTWKASQAGHADKTNAIGRFGNLRDLDKGLAGNEVVAAIGYSYDEWRDGQLPDGTNPGGGSTIPTNRELIAFNQFPRRFLDITCSSRQPWSATENVGSTFFIVGDTAADTNDDGSIDDTGPVLIGGAFEYPGAFNRMRDGISPYTYLPPYLIASPALVTSLTTAVGGTTTWFREGAIPTYTFSGAVAVLASIPYEEISYSPSQQPLTFIGVNDVSHGGTDYAEIYITQDSPISPACVVSPYATEGGAFTTATSISLPNKWYNKAVQQRTFSIPEENIAKDGTLDPLTGVFTPNIGAIKDDDAGDYIGSLSNYQRYGLTDDPEATGLGVEQGTLSRNGYGFLGFKTGTGPIAIMFDSGAGTYNDGVFPAVATGIILAEGANLNENHLIDPTSTTRKIVNAGWDNDRDQWLFISSDTTGAGVISVSADFSTAANNVGFLDQTVNFGQNDFPLSTTANAGLYIPNSMTNALDGFVCFGIFDDDANCRFGIKPILGASTAESDTCGGVTVSYDFYINASSSYFYRITGTTGRQAKVWVDYILFDGADALIATKLRERGMKVTIEAVEWFKRKIIHSGDLNIKQEEIELWMREQQDEFKQMMQDAERQGRVRKRKKQVSAYGLDLSEVFTPDYEDKEVQEFMKEYLPQSRPPTPEEQAVEKQRKGGYAPFSKNYYDEVFEN